MNAEEHEIQRTIWREQEAEEIEASKAKMAKDHGLERNAKFELAWKIANNIASNYTESSHAYEVEHYFSEVVEMILWHPPLAGSPNARFLAVKLRVNGCRQCCVVALR